MLTVEKLRACMPRLSAARAAECLPHLTTAMAERDISTPTRQAAFVAQLAHETGEMKWMVELDHTRVVTGCRYCQQHGPHKAGAQYEGREDLGNDRPGDGVLFKGRGPPQLTGRANYRAAGRALGIDLEHEPERAADPDVGFRVFGWFWASRELNVLADKGDFRGITRRINGGLNGLAERERYYRLALRALEAEPAVA